MDEKNGKAAGIWENLADIARQMEKQRAHTQELMKELQAHEASIKKALEQYDQLLKAPGHVPGWLSLSQVLNAVQGQRIRAMNTEADLAGYLDSVRRVLSKRPAEMAAAADAKNVIRQMESMTARARPNPSQVQPEITPASLGDILRVLKTLQNQAGNCMMILAGIHAHLKGKAPDQQQEDGKD